MPRLTRRMYDGWGLAEGLILTTPQGAKAVVDKLAAYENTGLEPEEVAALQAKLTKATNGRIVETVMGQYEAAQGRAGSPPCGNHSSGSCGKCPCKAKENSH